LTDKDNQVDRTALSTEMFRYGGQKVTARSFMWRVPQECFHWFRLVVLYCKLNSKRVEFDHTGNGILLQILR